jgi:orotate phosphoribosyltransferase-like protein
MTLLQRCAQLCADGYNRDEIAEALSLTREMIDWLMDSDSFAVMLERIAGEAP